jgi:exosortase/archaeosortase family protein
VAQEEASGRFSPGGPASLRFHSLRLLSFLTAAVLLVALLPQSAVRPVEEATAWATHWLLSALGVESDASASYVRLSQGILSMTRSCTGAFSVAVYAGLVLATSAPWKDRGAAILLGVPTLLILNLGRLLGAGLVLESLPRAFGPLHDYVFQVVMVLAVLALWFVWLQRLNNAR